MDESLIAHAVVTGLGATALLDLAMIVRKLALRIAPPDYGLLGRWIGHMPRGRFRHPSIVAAEPVAGERLLGWLAHYAIGVAFASLLLIACGPEWARHPTPGPALVVGLGTVVAPFLLMHPGMGAGFFASRTQRPGAARLQSVTTHAIFGLGLYVAAGLARLCCAA